MHDAHDENTIVPRRENNPIREAIDQDAPDALIQRGPSQRHGQRLADGRIHLTGKIETQASLMFLVSSHGGFEFRLGLGVKNETHRA